MKPYTITKHTYYHGSRKGDVFWVIRFNSGPMAGSTGNAHTRSELFKWARSLGY